MATQLKWQLSIKEICAISMFTALITVCSWISIPFQIPFTLQTLAIFLTIGILGTRRAFMSVLTYIILGAIGVPVFSGFMGGASVLLGKTGGYIFGFLLSVPIAGYLTKKAADKFIYKFFAMLAGLAVCYLFGTLWFMLVYSSGNISFSAVLSICVIPYIIPDIIKIIVAIVIAKKLKPLINI